MEQSTISRPTLLPVLSQQVNKTLEFDAENMKITNLPDANEYFNYKYLKGWKL